MKLIAAVDENFGIGKNGEIPWNVPGDFQFFKAMTYESTLIVGRKTYENIGGLPGRDFIVLSNTIDEAASSFEEAESRISDEVWIAGGGIVYEHYVGIADDIFLSKIPGTYDCDTFFPQDQLERHYDPVAKVPAEGFDVIRYTKTESKNT